MSAVQQKLVTFVEEGMTVIDRQGKKIGKVSLAFPGTNTTLSGDQAAIGTGVDEARLSEEARLSLPLAMLPEIRQRLLQSGFIRIDTGLLTRDRYALPDQIETVTSDSVYLGVDKDETLKF